MADKPSEMQRNAAWKIQERSQQMSRRYDFSDYDKTRYFLDQLEKISEKENYYPDLSFSKTHVVVSINARGEELSQVDVDFSVQVDTLVNSQNDDPD